MSLSTIRQAIRRRLPLTIIDLVRSVLYLGRRLPDHGMYVAAIAGKHGIEIGGPSTIFKTILPLYQAAGSLDGVNFAGQTVWEGSIAAGRTFNYLGNRKGTQFIAEATRLDGIATGTYDFVLSSNCLEHVANPIAAVLEWKRVLKVGGALILVLPNKRSNFDHRRPNTPFSHLLEDQVNGTTEHDLTHLEEILALHDLAMDPPAGTPEQFRQRSLENFSNRTLHHHVFDLELMGRLLDHTGFNVAGSSTTDTDFYAIGVKRA